MQRDKELYKLAGLLIAAAERQAAGEAGHRIAISILGRDGDVETGAMTKIFTCSGGDRK